MEDKKISFSLYKFAGLISTEGHKPYSHDESFTLYCTPGTMVRYAEDLSLMMKIMCQSEETRRKFEQKVAQLFILRNFRAVKFSILLCLSVNNQRLRYRLILNRFLQINRRRYLWTYYITSNIIKSFVRDEQLQRNDLKLDIE